MSTKQEILTKEEVLMLANESPLLASQELDKIFEIKHSEGYDKGYNVAYKKGQRDEVADKKFFGSLIAVVIIAVVFFISNFFYKRLRDGIEMETKELAACTSGNASQCLAGIKRDYEKEGLYSKVFLAETGKPLPGYEAMDTASFKGVKLTETSSGIHMDFGEYEMKLDKKEK